MMRVAYCFGVPFGVFAISTYESKAAVSQSGLLLSPTRSPLPRFAEVHSMPLAVHADPSNAMLRL